MKLVYLALGYNNPIPDLNMKGGRALGRESGNTDPNIEENNRFKVE